MAMEIDNLIREQLRNILDKEDTSEVQQPAKEDVREFQRLVENDPSQEVSGVRPVENNGVQPIGAVEQAQNVSPTGAVEQAQNVSPIRTTGAIDMPKRELVSREEALNDAVKLVDELAAGNLSPDELYRLQYVMKVLHIQGVTSSQTTQQVEQGIDTVLKQ